MLRSILIIYLQYDRNQWMVVSWIFKVIILFLGLGERNLEL